MAEPARNDAPYPGPGRRAIWEPVGNLVSNAAEAARAAVADLAAAPDCPVARRRVEMICCALDNLAEITRDLAGAERGRLSDEAVIEAACADAYARGVADCKAARCHLEVVGG